MPIDISAAIAWMSNVLQRYEIVKKEHTNEPLPEQKRAELSALLRSAIRHYSPPGSLHSEMMPLVAPTQTPPIIDLGNDIDTLAGILSALQADYLTGRLQTFTERVHSETFGDFLEMAEYLIEDEGLKDPAAVLAGGVLEQHLRKLCAKRGVTLAAKPKLDLMNADLAKANVYDKNQQKQITAWAGIRNDAAHADYGKYDAERVRLMIKGIQHFITVHPA